MTEEKKKLVIIDANSIIHRAYHALPLLTAKKGEVVNAVYGFLLVFLKAVKDLQPDFVVAAFDSPGPTLRHKRYKEYKAKRPPAPEDLYSQIPKVKEFLKVFGVPSLEKEGFEADDLIGTISHVAPRKQAYPRLEIVILSGDMDTLQLIGPKTKVYALRKGVKDVVLYDEDFVKEKFQGLRPDQLLDFKALRGDPSDNIPGVTGIGEKTASELLLKFGSLENLYRSIGEKTRGEEEIKPKLKETLLKYRDQAFLSRDLARIEKAVPIDFSLSECSFREIDKERVKKLLEEFEFYSLIKRLFNGEEENSVGENLKLW